MRSKEILKVKIGLSIVSIILLLVGSKLLFGNWTLIHWSMWSIIVIILYGGVYLTAQRFKNKKCGIIYNGFELVGTLIFIVAIIVATIMLLIFYSHISILFFGLTLIILSISSGVKIIIFDFEKKVVNGLFESRDPSFSNMIVDIHPDNDLIKVRTLDTGDTIVLKRAKYSSTFWTQLMENLKKVR